MTMKRLTIIISLIALSTVLSLLFLANASAQETAPIKIRLLADKTSYLPGEPIRMQIDVYNDTAGQVITRKGFMNQDFYLLITFTAPDGKTITTRYKQIGDEPGPPFRYQEKDAALVEVFQNLTQVIDNAHDYYDLPYGRYTAQVIASVETFSQGIDSDDDGVVDVAYLDYRNFFGEGGAVESNKVSFEIASPISMGKGSVTVYVNLLRIGSGSKPKTEKIPLSGVPVRLISRSNLAGYEPANWKVYPLIWSDAIDSIASGTTVNGMVSFDGVPQGDYVVLARHESVTIGSPFGSDDENWMTGQPISKHLHVMEKSDGKKAAGKVTIQKGSLLVITEPEYIEWDGTQELYPFVFETVGDWGIKTAIAPPEGFVADYQALSADVNNETEAVQFTITDVGSRWVPTDVTFTVTHKKKVKELKDKVGIKLSKRLSQAKGIGIFGEPESPVPPGRGKKGK
jgi:hypothetical protein